MKYTCPTCAHSLDLAPGKNLICGKCRIYLKEEQVTPMFPEFPEFEFSRDWKRREVPTLRIESWTKLEVERVFDLFIEREFTLSYRGFSRCIIKGPNKFKLELNLAQPHDPDNSTLTKHKQKLIEAITRKSGPRKSRYLPIPRKRDWAAILEENPDLVMLEE